MDKLKKLMEKAELSKSGYAGVMPDGNIVDRRLQPKAIPMQKNSMLGIPEPKSLDCQTEQAVIDMITSRGVVGRAKYGTSMDRTDLTPAQWAQHLQEELADGLQYAERVKQALELLDEMRQLINELSEHDHIKGSIYKSQSMKTKAQELKRKINQQFDHHG